MATDPGHPRMPLRLNEATGTIETVPQGSLTEVRQCASAVLRTPRGQRIETPRLGLPDPRWRPAVDVDAIADTLERWEPRATWTVESDPATGAVVGVRVTGVQ